MQLPHIYTPTHTHTHTHTHPTHTHTHPTHTLTPTHTHTHTHTHTQSIIIPELRQFPNSTSLTLHTWVSLDHARTNHPLSDVLLSRQSSHKRRILYSFYTASGAGFEAFFTKNLVLVVATVTKKEFITLELRECPLTPLEWVSHFPPYSYVSHCMRDRAFQWCTIKPI